MSAAVAQPPQSLESNVAKPDVKPRITTGVVGMWNGTRDGEEGIVDYQTGVTNINPPLEVEIVVHDMRTMTPQPSFETKGFGCVSHTTKLTVDEFLGGKTPEGKQLLHDKYFPECKELVEKVTGSKKVLPYIFRLRQQSVKPKEFAQRDMAVSALPVAHADRDRETAESGLVDQFGPEEAARLLKKYKRFAQVNVWRPIGQTIQRWPLLLVDTSNVTDWDYDTHLARVYPTNDPRVAIRGAKTHDCVLKHDPRYKYCYASDVKEDEALVFSSFDSDIRKFAPHGAFWDNNTADDAPVRRSIEVRTWAFFDPIDGEE